jgi:hypothetical protein
MALDASFYAAKVAEYGDDCKTMAGAFEAAVKRKDFDEARRYLDRFKDRASTLETHADIALEAATRS